MQITLHTGQDKAGKPFAAVAAGADGIAAGGNSGFR